MLELERERDKGGGGGTGREGGREGKGQGGVRGRERKGAAAAAAAGHARTNTHTHVHIHRSPLPPHTRPTRMGTWPHGVAGGEQQRQAQVRLPGAGRGSRRQARRRPRRRRRRIRVRNILTVGHAQLRLPGACLLRQSLSPQYRHSSYRHFILLLRTPTVALTLTIAILWCRGASAGSAAEAGRQAGSGRAGKRAAEAGPRPAARQRQTRSAWVREDPGTACEEGVRAADDDDDDDVHSVDDIE